MDWVISSFVEFLFFVSRSVTTASKNMIRNSEFCGWRVQIFIQTLSLFCHFYFQVRSQLLRHTPLRRDTRLRLRLQKCRTATPAGEQPTYQRSQTAQDLAPPSPCGEITVLQVEVRETWRDCPSMRSRGKKSTYSPLCFFLAAKFDEH